MASSPTRATREDVARAAQVSVAVVSYVVNDGPRPVSAAARKRVLEAILATGYKPNGIARALALGVSGVYGLIVPDISNPFFAAMAHALEEAVSSTGKVLLLGDFGADPSRERELVNTFSNRQIDGLLYIGYDGQPQVGGALTAGIPVVMLDRSATSTSSLSVTVNNVAGANAATRHLISHGYRDIGIVSGPPQLSTARDRTTGWHEAMTDAGLTIHPEWNVQSDFSRQGGFAAGRALFSVSSGRPRAVFIANEQQAVGFLAAASSAGIRVPDDIAIVTFDGTDDSKYSCPPLSTVAQPLALIAKIAVDLLGRNTDEGPRNVVCGYKLVLRASCGSHEVDQVRDLD